MPLPIWIIRNLFQPQKAAARSGYAVDLAKAFGHRLIRRITENLARDHTGYAVVWQRNTQAIGFQKANVVCSSADSSRLL